MSGRQSFLIIFDFDHTIIDCNSDEVIPDYFGRTDFMNSLMKKNSMQYTDIVDAVMAPFTAEQIIDAGRKSIVMDEKMPDVFRYLVQQRDGCPPLVEIAIASDANLLYIESSIAALIPFARGSISQIHSNSFHTVSEETSDCSTGQRRCRVCWYEPKGHDCFSCTKYKKRNMCKSRIISRLLHTTQLVDPTIIFIGDGTNDFCPILNILRPRDYMFARRDFPIHSLLSNPDRCGPGGCCRVNLWSKATELLECFHRAMDPARRLPTIVRFRDVSAKEFRTFTLVQRIPQILERTLKDNDATVVPAGRELLMKLAEALRHNGPVATLPGTNGRIPAWLAAYASLPEFDTLPDCAHAGGVGGDCADGCCVLPRWGQLPWLAGEVYFYHLVAQYCLLAEPSDPHTESPLVPNLVTPYASALPVYTHTCAAVGANGLASALRGAAPEQSFDASFIAREEPDTVSDGVLLSDKRSYARDVSCPSVLVPQGLFQPYRDYCVAEKNHVLRSFIKAKICPMLACQPWSADEKFVDVMLRWMLWGNSLDLSMYTIDQLHSAHSTAGGSVNGSINGSSDEKDFLSQRTAEEVSVRAQDANVLGNDITAVADLVRHIVRTEPTDGSRTINIVMDNVGVECVADLIFSLWLLKHHPSLRVVLHVKCMAYFVSDVTPQDFDVLLHELQQSTKEDPSLKSVVSPFVQLLREAFESGRIRVDADTVWTQPCEYRELPPRMMNTFFYTQRILTEPELQKMPSTTEPRQFTARSALVIFKGDLNFRRLIGDRHWDARAYAMTLSAEERTAPAIAQALLDTPLDCQRAAPSFTRIVSDFWPVATVPVCAVRTIKSECCVGISEAKQDEMDRDTPTWRTSGKYGVFLLASCNK